MSQSCKFSEQIEKVVKKARKMMGWVLHTFRTRDLKPMLILYKPVILPHLEYCSQVGVQMPYVMYVELRLYSGLLW